MKLSTKITALAFAMSVVAGTSAGAAPRISPPGAPAVAAEDGINPQAAYYGHRHCHWESTPWGPRQHCVWSRPRPHFHHHHHPHVHRPRPHYHHHPHFHRPWHRPHHRHW